MDVVRSIQGRDQYRVLESFWASQIRSKSWLVNNLLRLCEWDWEDRGWGEIYVFGGWYGVVGTLLKRAFPTTHVVSIDIDPTCAEIGQRMNPDVEFVTCDMARFHDYRCDRPFTAINCSTEHVLQDTFDAWRNNIPKTRPHEEHHVLVLQGNNYDSIPEHVRCTDSLESFKAINRVGKKCFYAGELNCVQFTRYMSLEFV